ncbi:MAG TPA: diaminopimelate epimerase [Paludibacteraceae bacterium]|jgi:diaminopimelate epimerase|nr:diaminopimelate epimerase [Paludibacteraceae bacterium]NLJ21102.1 diaminopimelate epimerase [Bacteroidales bacterium]HOH55922.1 diaminopimelate epimerase [Paludibacteraceae bacterium]
MKFTKMHGIGNDYIYINGFEELVQNPGELSIRLSDRHKGVGSDGLVMILPSSKADFRMQMFNADGSEAEMCGNAARCIGKYVYEKGLTNKTELTLETLAGIKTLQLFLDDDNNVVSVTVDMGNPELEPSKIPTTLPGKQIVNFPVSFDGVNYHITCVSMGNPHTVIFTQNIATLDIETIGKKIENAPIFPRRTNVEFIEIIDKGRIKMRVWERGSGETMACGTGACASVVAGVLNELVSRKATVELLGGNLEIEWNENDDHVYLTGPAETVFEGEIF